MARVFTPEEQEWIDRSTSPDTTLWMFWAAKEAAFKAVSKLRPGLSFRYRAYVVTLFRDEDYPGGDGHSRETDPGYHCRREAARPGEPGPATPVILQDTNGEALPIQERGMVMTPVGPADAFFTLSPRRVHCVAAVRNGYGGDSATTPVHVRDERRDGPFDPSAAVRRAAIHHLASVLKASPYYIDIRREAIVRGYRAPRVFLAGSRTDIDISLSHDGQYIAFAVHY
jgi:hypothetical protein